MKIQLASSEADIERCYPIVARWREIEKRSQFVRQIQEQQKFGYYFVYLEDDRIEAIAGFHIIQTLARGRVLYLDDWIGETSEYTSGYSRILFDWLMDYAREHSCQSLRLNSSVRNIQAHQFYFKNKMKIEAFQFSISV
ncbi:GNAT family N-acetyltransferase [Oscillatoriales cyanobacterium LEGE 11467]|uniref:GNAT family N-acetyltransferase n=1 Tax=Zarconia navalis LEGE 11467 TaxID=1828826 RepID=A0A928Z8J4_9CYAN|nr:GNAT family N-acetyltransferase [Zarconia navalis]MBE9041650.1 GNAT family N-acetyltransferase [Zarconia navalis LEGE 11467]